MATYKSIKYNISGADLTGLTASQIPNLDTAKVTTGTFADARISESSVTQHAATFDDNKLQSNIALLGFKTAVNGSLAKYNLQDQIIDEFEDATGIDAGNSTNENLTSGAYWGRTADAANPGETLSATGGGGSSGTTSGTAGAGGTGTGGTSQGTGGTGGAGGSSTGSAGSSGTDGGAGGGGGSGYTGTGGDGGDGDASYYTGGGGGGASDGDGATMTAGAGGSGYKSGGAGGNVPTGAIDGSGEGGVGSTYGGGDHGTDGSIRKNSGGGGGYAGGGGGGCADSQNSGGSAPDYETRSGDGGSGAAVITYTNSGSQVVHKFSGTSYTPPNGSTDLVVYAIGGGGGGGLKNAGVAGGGGGGMAKSNTFSDAVRIITFTIGSGGAAATTWDNDGGTGGTTSVTIGESFTYNDLTLQSTANTASSEATKADLIMLMENDEGTASINTDIKGYVTANGGSNWTEGTLVDEGTWGTNKKIYAFHDATVTGGTDLRYKITTHNQGSDKRTKIHAVSLGWKA